MKVLRFRFSAVTAALALILLGGGLAKIGASPQHAGAASASAQQKSGAGVAPAKQDQAAASDQISLSFDPAQSTVNWDVDSTLHTVHGTFMLTRGAIKFVPDTGKASGEIVVSALSGKTDNSSRDAKMHKEILETAKFPDASFRPTQIEGNVARTGASDVKVRGIFSVHGVDHHLTADVHVEMSPERWKATCKFEVPYIAWGIKDPSNFLLKVKSVVNVEIEAQGAVQTGK